MKSPGFGAALRVGRPSGTGIAVKPKRYVLNISTYMKHDHGVNVCSRPLEDAMATCKSALPVVYPGGMSKSGAFGADPRKRCVVGRG